MDPDELIAGRYRLVSQVGRGAMGVVWRARDERLDRTVAVKQLLADSAAREARIAGRLRHPNAVAVYDVVVHDGNPCLIMEYVPAENLGRRGVLPPERVARIGAQVASALAEAHAAGVVHRDVKPDNVLLAEDGTAKITDFGVSRAVGVGTLTATGMLAGTPAYLAPEVASGADADPRSDVFSLGATLYAALEGEPPFGFEDNPITLLHKVARAEIRPPQRSGPLTGPLLALLRRDPAERPTMREAQQLLAAVADGRPPPAFRPRTPTMVLQTRRVPRRQLVLGGAAAALVAAGVVIGVLIADGSGAGSPAAGADPAASTTTTVPPSPCQASYEVKQSWDNGYLVEVTVTNRGADDELTGWLVTWTLPAGHQIDQLWNGERETDGPAVTVRNVDYNGIIAAGANVKFGLTMRAPGAGEREVPAIDCRED
ncbi:MAG TPA: serine/threonine-protein kinase [Actinophytocola sp.]|uniref:serine/threonine-protein kinase n=1 Tax=Actinophytocola sp. TaxID=1872138 RepID=UPI002DBCEA00|nr:serine/threonine-protein kinase [Actinophytocola sp.]HEU5475492.1 serine/threonine-protein kinase [Actinophytocola sp.]